MMLHAGDKHVVAVMSGIICGCRHVSLAALICVSVCGFSKT